MKAIKRLLCLVSVVLLLTMTACQAPGKDGTAEISVPPTQGVEETLEPSQTVSPDGAASTQAEPGEGDSSGKESHSGAASTPTPTSKPANGPTSTPRPTQRPQAAPVPTPAPKPVATPEPTPTTKTCYLSIECKTILGRMEDLTPGKEGLIPADGVILSRKSFTFQEGETVFDVLCRAAKQYGIHLEYEFTPGFGSYYIEGIHNLYEFDCGAGSGWMYYVNGAKPNYGCSKYTLKDGDVIQWRYTCDLGFDL